MRSTILFDGFAKLGATQLSTLILHCVNKAKNAFEQLAQTSEADECFIIVCYSKFERRP